MEQLELDDSSDDDDDDLTLTVWPYALHLYLQRHTYSTVRCAECNPQIYVFVFLVRYLHARLCCG